MALTQVWGILVIFVVCPLLGGLPLIRWITSSSGRRLDHLGTRNVSVSAAFYHGGRWAGTGAVLSEAFKGIAAVLLTRSFFPSGSAWEFVALMALVMGRYWFAGGAGTTNVVWGYVVYDPIAAGLVFLIGGISFTVLRERRQAKFGILVLFPLITALRHPQDGEVIVAAIALAVLIGWIYTKIPDDLALDARSATGGSRSMFRFFQGDRSLRTLDSPLDAAKHGQKAATLSQLGRLGYPIPPGWVLAPGDDPQLLIDRITPTAKYPYIVRSSAVGEDSETASAAGQYESIVGITSREALLPAITQCFASYNGASATQYRRDRRLPDAFMAIVVQQQVRGVFSGVAFSRDPIARQGNVVVIEALPGDASRVVSGRITPETYRVEVSETTLQSDSARGWMLPDDLTLEVEGSGDVPPQLIQQVAYLARHLESHYGGVPQDIEWSYDGKELWLLQSRPVTTLLPIWTRKIAAEVIPGLIRPLTWSINRPLTCGVWGEIFTLVLQTRAQGLDFNETATLHYSRSYFNASLLGQIFRRMGLPPESLEFLTRGAKLGKPPLRSTLRNIPGLLRLARREWRLEVDFHRDYQRKFAPAIARLAQQSASNLSEVELLHRIDRILELLQRATYYSILAPLSAALRKAIFKVKDEDLDNGATPEVAALRSLQALAVSARQTFNTIPTHASAVFSSLAATPGGNEILEQLEQTIDRYGYLSEVGTDIAVPTWSENPEPVRALFAQFCLNLPPETAPTPSRATNVQRRFNLKGQVTELYSRLLAELRWSFVALEQCWLAAGLLNVAGEIFLLTFDEIRLVIERGQGSLGNPVVDVIEQRQEQLKRDRQLETIPFLVYGDDPPTPILDRGRTASGQLHGIGASPGQVEGRVRVVRSLNEGLDVGRDTIVVVPYTDSGWAALLAQVGGLIAETGGRLSHGAIVAREYRIPAVMDIPNATQLLHDGQLIRLDGQHGVVEIL